MEGLGGIILSRMSTVDNYVYKIIGIEVNFVTSRCFLVTTLVFIGCILCLGGGRDGGRNCWKVIFLLYSTMLPHFGIVVTGK